MEQQRAVPFLEALDHFGRGLGDLDPLDHDDLNPRERWSGAGRILRPLPFSAQKNPSALVE
jgi:hypothetical protein